MATRYAEDNLRVRSCIPSCLRQGCFVVFLLLVPSWLAHRLLGFSCLWVGALGLQTLTLPHLPSFYRVLRVCTQGLILAQKHFYPWSHFPTHLKISFGPGSGYVA